MVIITIMEEKLRKSKYYSEDCWDYPLEELNYLTKNKENSEFVYALTEGNRIYETICTIDKINNLIKGE